jgi:hypothetical protein
VKMPIASQLNRIFMGANITEVQLSCK